MLQQRLQACAMGASGAPLVEAAAVAAAVGVAVGAAAVVVFVAVSSELAAESP